MAAAHRIEFMSNTIIIESKEQIRPEDVALANRITEVVGPQKRLVVRERYSGAFRVITAEYSFQFLPNSPEIVTVEDFGPSLTRGCVHVIATAQENKRVMEKLLKESEQNLRYARRREEELLKENLEVKGKLQKAMLGEAKTTAALALITDAAATLLHRWPRRNTRGNLLAAKKHLKATVGKL